MTDTTAKASCWILTINNPTPQDDEEVARARQKGWKVEGQLEKGKDGTPHYQLMVKTPQVRFSAVKKAFARAHIEPARDSIAVSKYVVKEETRVGALPLTQARYPSMSKLWEMMTVWWDAREMKISEEIENGESLEECLMRVFDRAIGDFVMEGYFVESMAVNPQVRGEWKKFWNCILIRTRKILKEAAARAEETVVQIPVVETQPPNASQSTRPTCPPPPPPPPPPP